MIIDVHIPFGNEPNKNGRIYSKEIVKQIVDKINETPNRTLVTSKCPEESSVNLNDVVAFIESANYNETNNSLNMKIKTTNKLIHLAVKNEKDFNEFFSVVPAGIGKLNENKTVEEYELISFYIVPKQDSSFKSESKPNIKKIAKDLSDFTGDGYP